MLESRHRAVLHVVTLWLEPPGTLVCLVTLKCIHGTEDLSPESANFAKSLHVDAESLLEASHSELLCQQLLSDFNSILSEPQIKVSAVRILPRLLTPEREVMPDGCVDRQAISNAFVDILNSLSNVVL
jgi:hypothetical protein